jgi:hypothetical protein
MIEYIYIYIYIYTKTKKIMRMEIIFINNMINKIINLGYLQVTLLSLL